MSEKADMNSVSVDENVKPSPESEAATDNKTVADSPVIRQQLVDTAVKFLQSEQVKSNPLDKKVQFMKRKGLTDDEIELAVNKAQLSDVGSSRAGVGNIVPGNVPVAGYPVPGEETRSTLSTIRDIFTGLLVISTATFGVYKLYKWYLEPVWYNKNEEHERMKRIEEFLLDIGTNMRQDINQLQSSVHAVNDIVKTQQNQLENISRDLTKSNTGLRGDSVSLKQLDDLKSEIATLKGLLLNRKQFPAAPVSLQPTLPSWMKQTETEPSAEPAAGDEGACSSKEQGHDDDDINSGSGSGSNGSSPLEIINRNSNDST